MIWAVNVKAPAVPGVPEIVPLAPKVRPAGSDPEMTLHVYGAVPPAGCRLRNRAPIRWRRVESAASRWSGRNNRQSKRSTYRGAGRIGRLYRDGERADLGRDAIDYAIGM